MEMDELEKLKTKRIRIRAMTTDVLQMIDREIPKANITGSIDSMDECMSLLLAKETLLSDLNSKIEQEIRDRLLYDDEVRISEGWSETIVQYKSKINQLLKKIPFRSNCRQDVVLPYTNRSSLPFIQNFSPMNLYNFPCKADLLNDDDCVLIGAKFQAGNVNTSYKMVPPASVIHPSTSLNEIELNAIDIVDSDEPENMEISDQANNTNCKVTSDDSGTQIKKELVTFEVNPDINQRLANKIVWIDDDSTSSKCEVVNTTSGKKNELSLTIHQTTENHEAKNISNSINEQDQILSKESASDNITLSHNPIPNFSTGNENEYSVNKIVSRLPSCFSSQSALDGTPRINDQVHKRSYDGSPKAAATASVPENENTQSVLPTVVSACNVVYRKVNEATNSNFHVYLRPTEPIIPHNRCSVQGFRKNNTNASCKQAQMSRSLESEKTNQSDICQKEGQKNIRKCGECHLIFPINHYLKHCLDVHGDPYPYKCQNCKFATCIPNQLKSHIGRRVCKKNKNHSCTNCNLNFETELGLVNHCLDTHKDALPFRCESCDFRSDEKHELCNHQKIHAENKFSECEICGRSFNSGNMTIHRCKKRFNCKVCFKQFCFKRDLTIHAQAHTDPTLGDQNRSAAMEDDLPFECIYCKELFLDRKAYTTHCSICKSMENTPSSSKYILQRGSLRIHKQRHFVKYPHCEYCSQIF